MKCEAIEVHLQLWVANLEFNCSASMLQCSDEIFCFLSTLGWDDHVPTSQIIFGWIFSKNKMFQQTIHIKITLYFVLYIHFIRQLEIRMVTSWMRSNGLNVNSQLRNKYKMSKKNHSTEAQTNKRITTLSQSLSFRFVRRTFLLLYFIFTSLPLSRPLYHTLHKTICSLCSEIFFSYVFSMLNVEQHWHCVAHTPSSISFQTLCGRNGFWTDTNGQRIELKQCIPAQYIFAVCAPIHIKENLTLRHS